MAKEQNEPVETPEPEATEEPTPAPAEPAEIADSPWKADLESNFSDPKVRAEVDAYMRETVQPRITKLEQATAPNRDAERLWNDFISDPQATFHNVATEIYGEEESTKIKELLAAEAEGRESELSEEEEATAKEQVNDPRLKAVIEDFEARQAEEAYEVRLGELQEEHKDDDGVVKVKAELFHPFVVAADGNFDAAYVQYQQWAKDAADEFGIKIPKAEDTTEEAPETVKGGTTPPSTTPEFKDFDEALDAWEAEKKNPPVTV